MVTHASVAPTMLATWREGLEDHQQAGTSPLQLLRGDRGAEPDLDPEEELVGSLVLVEVALDAELGEQVARRLLAGVPGLEDDLGQRVEGAELAD
jgi:hypothetical protein